MEQGRSCHPPLLCPFIPPSLHPLHPDAGQLTFQGDGPLLAVECDISPHRSLHRAKSRHLLPPSIFPSKPSSSCVNRDGQMGNGGEREAGVQGAHFPFSPGKAGRGATFPFAQNDEEAHISNRDS
ncbi:unnamed protein product [Pleuronectes platessa]|uniref:Uncharacterized protein n=1 Tax=Pleuronectes platessa TaxID=8262 RepID=A0A9N7Z4J1_PLEPL|nr:unnamed protein product [Pleuronectes platessa]